MSSFQHPLKRVNVNIIAVVIADLTWTQLTTKHLNEFRSQALVGVLLIFQSLVKAVLSLCVLFIIHPLLF